MSNEDIVQRLLESIGMEGGHALPDDSARLQIHGNRVVDAHAVHGLSVDVDEQTDSIAARITVEAGVKLRRPVHICFGLLPEDGLQRIDLDLQVEEEAEASILAHCTFPNAVQVEHRMEAKISVGPRSSYSYLERHVHGPHGGVLVIPNATVVLEEGARFKTEFELVKGRAGRIAFDYRTECRAHSTLEMIARIGARGTDDISIREAAALDGPHARAALKSYIALRDEAKAEVFNEIVATAPYARGHVDCKEIVQDRAVARAVPVVDVQHPAAHVTHEAAIGSVDSKQLETLLSRGLSEDDAVDLIIEGMLS